MRISLIVAMSENGVIGRGNDLPWHLPADLRRFRRLTMGHHIIMGRKTYESIGRPLPGREMIVISRQPHYSAPGATVVSNVAAALAAAAADDEAFIIGGAAIYRQAIPRVKRIYLTQIHASVEGDTQFPDVDWSRFQLVEDKLHPADEKNPFAYSFQLFQRIE